MNILPGVVSATSVVVLTAVGVLASARFLVAAPAVSLHFEPPSAGAQLVMGVAPTPTNGVCAIYRAPSPDGPWAAIQSHYTTSEVARITLEPPAETSFLRVTLRDLSDPVHGWSNLIESYSLLTTIAGAGGATGTANKWHPSMEGGRATDALLSRPHIVHADEAGNLYIADKEGHAIRVVRPDGTIHTHAGTGSAGDGSDTPTSARQVALNQPNGCWVRGDGTVYVLDLANAKIRRIAPDGVCTTLTAVPGGLGTGRGLWVRDDEQLAYASAGGVIKRWTAAEGVTVLPHAFVDLGNLDVDPRGRLGVTDRGGHRVYRIEEDGTRTALAGNGTSRGGGDGFPALETGFNGVRGIQFLPTGAFFLATSSGAQVWYVDTAGIAHLFLHGQSDTRTHAGDGSWFYAPAEPRMSEARSVTTDRRGNIYVTENDAGYVRRIDFLPRSAVGIPR